MGDTGTWSCPFKWERIIGLYLSYGRIHTAPPGLLRICLPHSETKELNTAFILGMPPLSHERSEGGAPHLQIKQNPIICSISLEIIAVDRDKWVMHYLCNNSFFFKKKH